MILILTNLAYQVTDDFIFFFSIAATEETLNILGEKDVTPVGKI